MRPVARFIFVLLLACVGCTAGVPGPEPTRNSSPEAVRLSLETIEPEQSLAFFSYDEQAPFDLQDEFRRELDGMLLIDFTYASPKGGRVPARLIIPSGSGPFPGIVYMHGSSGDIELMTPEAVRFARLGAAAILIDSPHIRPGGFIPDGSKGSSWPYFTEQDRRDQIQLIVDLQRAVDILQARPEIDASRLAYIGISYGGAMGGLLAGVETRLKAYVLIVGDGGLVEHTSEPNSNGWPDHFSQPWVEQMWPIEPLQFVGRAAPAALLYQNGLYDQAVSPSDALRYQAAGSEPKTMLWYEGGHEISGWDSAWADRARWLQGYLGQPLFWFEPDYRSGTLLLDRGGSIWASLSLFTLLFFLWAFSRAGVVAPIERLMWCISALLLGPIAILVYRLARGTWPQSDDTTAVPAGWRVAVIAVTYLSSAMSAAMLLGTLLDNLLQVRSALLQLGMAYLLPLAAFWLLLALLRKRLELRVAAKLTLANILWAVSVPLGSSLAQAWNMTSDIDPRLWWVFVIGGIVGWLLLLPLTNLLLHHGWIRWHSPGAAVLQESRSGRISRSWTVAALSLSYLLVLLALGFVIVQSSGMSLGEVIQALG